MKYPDTLKPNKQAWEVKVTVTSQTSKQVPFEKVSFRALLFPRASSKRPEECLLTLFLQELFLFLQVELPVFFLHLDPFSLFGSFFFPLKEEVPERGWIAHRVVDLSGKHLWHRSPGGPIWEFELEGTRR